MQRFGKLLILSGCILAIFMLNAHAETKDLGKLIGSGSLTLSSTVSELEVTGDFNDAGPCITSPWKMSATVTMGGNSPSGTWSIKDGEESEQFSGTVTENYTFNIASRSGSILLSSADFDDLKVDFIVTVTEATSVKYTFTFEGALSCSVDTGTDPCSLIDDETPGEDTGGDTGEDTVGDTGNTGGEDTTQPITIGNTDDSGSGGGCFINALR